MIADGQILRNCTPFMTLYPHWQRFGDTPVDLSFQFNI